MLTTCNGKIVLSPHFMIRCYGLAHYNYIFDCVFRTVEGMQKMGLNNNLGRPSTVAFWETVFWESDGGHQCQRLLGAWGGEGLLLPPSRASQINKKINKPENKVAILFVTKGLYLFICLFAHSFIYLFTAVTFLCLMHLSCSSWNHLPATKKKKRKMKKEEKK